MIIEDIFKITMAMIDEVLETGELDKETTAEYRGKTLPILTMLQAEIIGIENKFRKGKEIILPSPLTKFTQPVQLDTIKSTTLLTNGLAAHLLIDENPNVASFFNQRYEEMKLLFLGKRPFKQEERKDVYDSKLNY